MDPDPIEHGAPRRPTQVVDHPANLMLRPNFGNSFSVSMPPLADSLQRVLYRSTWLNYCRYWHLAVRKNSFRELTRFVNRCCFMLFTMCFKFFVWGG